MDDNRATHGPPLPDLFLYGRAGCHLCEEAREMVDALLGRRPRPAGARTSSSATSTTDPDWHRAYLTDHPGAGAGRSAPRTRDAAWPGSARFLSRRARTEARRWPVTGPHLPRRGRRRRDQLPLAVRPAARARVSRPADGDRRGRFAGAAHRRRAGLAVRHAARLRRRVRPRLHASWASRPRSPPVRSADFLPTLRHDRRR